MAYVITINGVDRTGDVVHSSVVIEDILNDQQNTCTFKFVNRSGTGMPATDQEVTITLATGTKIFGGYIISRDLKRDGVGEAEALIRCVDYSRLFDRNLVHQSYSSMTDAAIIADIVSTYCSGLGITTTNVVTGVTIDQISFNYLQPSQVMRKICDLTGRNWYIDYNKDIHYFPQATNPAPFNIVDQSMTPVDENMLLTPAGTLVNGATYSAGVYTQLTSTVPNGNGQLEYTKTLGSHFTMQASISSSGGGTAGESIYFYAGFTVTPTDPGQGSGGYIVSFDDNGNTIRIYWNGSLLSTTAGPTFSDGTTRTVKVIFKKNIIEVYVGSTLYVTYTDSVRTYPGTKIGIGGNNSATKANNHRVYSLNIYENALDFKYLHVNKDATQLKNRIYVRGGTKLSDATYYEVKGDGATRKFPLPDKPHPPTGSPAVTVKINGVLKTLGIKNINLTGYDYYLNYEEKYIEQDSGAVVLATTDTLRVDYSYDIPILIAQEDSTSIMANGVKEFAIFDKSIRTTQAARDRATAELTDYANSLVEASFTTHTDGFISGQYMTINMSEYGVNASYIITKVTSRTLGGGYYSYDISLASAKTMGIIRFLIELLEANKNLIELDDNEVIDELLSVTDSLLSDSITDAMTIDSAGAYATWCTDSLQATPTTRARWDLFQWG